LITTQDLQQSWAIARTHMLQKNFESARKLLELLYVKVRHVELTLDYAHVLMQLKKFTEAHAVIALSLERYPKESRFHALQASLLYQNGQSKKALILYKSLLAEEPENPVYWTNAAYCACLEHQFVEAVAFFQQSERFITAYPSAWLRNYACALLMSKHPKEALTYFAQLKLQSTLDAECWFHYGLAFDLTGDDTQAQQAYLQALQHNSAHIASLYNLSILYQRQSLHLEAKTCWEQILQIQPDHILAKTLLQSSLGAPLTQLPLPFVQALFDQYSFNYEEHLKSVLEYTAPAQARSFMIQHFPESSPGIVIDLGAGTGVMGHIMRDLATHMTAIDCSAGMLLQARTSQMYDHYVEADILEWAAQTNVWADYMTLIEVTNYLGPSTEGLINHLWKRLHVGGVILLTAELLTSSTNELVTLLPTARFAFKEAFFNHIAQNLPYSHYIVDTMPIRKQGQDYVKGLYVVFKKMQ